MRLLRTIGIAQAPDSPQGAPPCLFPGQQANPVVICELPSRPQRNLITRCVLRKILNLSVWKVLLTGRVAGRSLAGSQDRPLPPRRSMCLAGYSRRNDVFSRGRCMLPAPLGVCIAEVCKNCPTAEGRLADKLGQSRAAFWEGTERNTLPKREGSSGRLAFEDRDLRRRCAKIDGTEISPAPSRIPAANNATTHYTSLPATSRWRAARTPSSSRRRATKASTSPSPNCP